MKQDHGICKKSFWCIFGLVSYSLLVTNVYGALMNELSLRPPHETFDAEGSRRVSNWNVGGDASIHKNFLRLTKDRASKRGWAWSQNENTLDEWSATLRFRVSGQGRRLFGDGFVLWFTQDPLYREGRLHGYADHFTGFGIIFDTFVNAEARHAHKDVSLVVNDGEKALEVPHGGIADPDAPGCDADFRFFEGRDDFNVNSQSLAQISFKDNKVSVRVDAKATGEWKTCFEDFELPIPASWHKNGYFGLTATTGQLADNHDIISLSVSDAAEEVLDDQKKIVAGAPLHIESGNEEVDRAVEKYWTHEKDLVMQEVNTLYHELEHRLTAVNDNIRAALRKIEEQEEAAMRRIEKIELDLSEAMRTELRTRLDSSLEDRLKMLEGKVSSAVHSKITDQIAPTLETHMNSTRNSWLIPFIMLTSIVIAVAIFARRTHQKLAKSHLP